MILRKTKKSYADKKETKKLNIGMIYYIIYVGRLEKETNAPQRLGYALVP